MCWNRCCLLFVLVLNALGVCFGSAPGGSCKPCDAVQDRERLLNFTKNFRDVVFGSQHNVAIAFMRFIVKASGQSSIEKKSDFIPIYPEKAISRPISLGADDVFLPQVFTSLGYNQNQTDLCTYQSQEVSDSYKAFFKGSRASSPNQLLNISEMYSCTEPQILCSIILNWNNWLIIIRQKLQKAIATKFKNTGYDLFIELHICSYWSPCLNCTRLLSNFVQGTTKNHLCPNASAHKTQKPLKVYWSIYYSYNEEYTQQPDRIYVRDTLLLSPTVVWRKDRRVCLKYE